MVLQVLFTTSAVRAADRYTVRDDLTVEERTRSLVWQRRGPDQPMPLEQAAAYCGSLTLAGASDWRLPEREELQGLLEPERGFPVIDPAAFPGTKPLKYWSKTRDSKFVDYAWSVGFGSGLVSLDRVDHPNFIRCVRRP